MEVNTNLKNYIIKTFPKFELCNEIILHNKVFKGNYDYIRLIPKGRKMFIWFKRHYDKVATFFIEIHTRTKQITKIYQYNVCFNKFLTCGDNGTIVYGTLFHSEGKPVFSIEDIIYFKSRFTNVLDWNNKLPIFNELFSNIKQVSYGTNDVLIYFPHILSYNTINKDTVNDNLQEYLKDYLKNVDYTLYSVQYFKNNKCFVDNNVSKYNYNSTKITVVNNTKHMYVKATINNDVYELFDLDGEYINIANIPDYKTSVMMNKCFRIIKENNNLDLLEESDDEDEFENVDDNKFVDLNKICKVECNYNNKFKMWVPLRIIEEIVNI